MSINAFLYSPILYNVLNIHFWAEASFTKLIQREQSVEIIKYCCQILDDAKFFCPFIKFLSKLKNNYIFALNCGLSFAVVVVVVFFRCCPFLSFNQIFSVCHFNLLVMKNLVVVFNAFSKYIRKWAHIFEQLKLVQLTSVHRKYLFSGKRQCLCIFFFLKIHLHHVIELALNFIHVLFLLWHVKYEWKRIGKTTTADITLNWKIKND